MPDSVADLEPPADESAATGPIDTTARIFEHVRTAILTGELPPGSWISQNRLATELDVSRTPMREALRLLQNEGLVESDYHRRPRVAALSLEDLEDLYAMRIALEPLAVRLTVADLDDRDVEALATCLRVMDEALADGVFATSIGPHRTFHFTLISRVDRRMRLSIENFWDHAERYRRLYQDSAEDRLALLRLAMREHYAILDAARSRDARTCSRLVAEHLARTALTVIAQVDQAHDPRRVRDALRYVVESA